MICGIYKITNLITNKIYIGQSINIPRRWAEHKSRAYEKNTNCYNKPLYRSIRKYGKENFILDILEECPAEKLNEREAYYIGLYNSIVPKGYNILASSDKDLSKIKCCITCGKPISYGTISNLCKKCYAKTTRVVERPTKEELYELLKQSNFCAVGRKYHVSDNTIRKWCSSYGLSTKAKDYK